MYLSNGIFYIFSNRYSRLSNGKSLDKLIIISYTARTLSSCLSSEQADQSKFKWSYERPEDPYVATNLNNDLALFTTSKWKLSPKMISKIFCDKI